MNQTPDGIYVVKGVIGMSGSAVSCVEKLDMKVLPLLLITTSGRMWCLQTCSRKRHATPTESIVVTVGTAWMHLDSLSTTTRMALYPLDSRSSLIVSMEMTSQQWLGIWLGISFPTFCVRKDLQQLQASHPAT